MKVTHYPEHLDKRGKMDYDIPNSAKLSEMGIRLKQLNSQEKLYLE